jgi:predicted nucleotide-binding protein (sugar kinase/HSP70/actin superfamily)
MLFFNGIKNLVKSLHKFGLWMCFNQLSSSLIILIQLKKKCSKFYTIISIMDIFFKDMIDVFFKNM